MKCNNLILAQILNAIATEIDSLKQVNITISVIITSMTSIIIIKQVTIIITITISIVIIVIIMIDPVIRGWRKGFLFWNHLSRVETEVRFLVSSPYYDDESEERILFLECDVMIL